MEFDVRLISVKHSKELKGDDDPSTRSTWAKGSWASGYYDVAHYAGSQELLVSGMPSDLHCSIPPDMIRLIIYHIS